MASNKKPTVHGYSGKPLFQKMGLKPGMVCLVLYGPDHYPQLVEGAVDVKFQKRAKSPDVIHLFCARRAVLEKNIERVLGLLGHGGMLWVSWPKKSSDAFVDLTEDHLREIILPRHWVDVKVCAVDETWSGLKFLRRKK